MSNQVSTLELAVEVTLIELWAQWGTDSCPELSRLGALEDDMRSVRAGDRRLRICSLPTASERLLSGATSRTVAVLA